MANSDYSRIRRALKHGGLSSAVATVSHVVLEAPEFDLSYVSGIDPDLYAGVIDYPKVHANGVSFANIRVGEGGYGVDSQLKNSQAHAKGLVRRNYYWFLTMRQSAGGQARDCLSYIGGDFDANSTLYVDFEDTYSFGKGSQYEHLNAGFLKSFLEDVSSMNPSLDLGIYTGLDFWKNYGSSDPLYGFEKYKLWISWPVNPYREPPVPAPWLDWFYHQWTFAGDESKYGAPDLDYQNKKFNGG